LFIGFVHTHASELYRIACRLQDAGDLFTLFTLNKGSLTSFISSMS